MATYDKAANYSTKTLLQQDNDSWESVPKYEVDRKLSYASSTLSTASTVEVAPSSLEKLKSRLASAKEARDRRASLFETWERKLPTYYAKQTYPTVESYPPHRTQYACQTRHQSWYPHYKASSTSSQSSGTKLDASKIEDLKKEKCHQSWYPHYKTSNASTHNSGVDHVASKLGGLKDRVVFKLGQVTEFGIDESMKASHPKYSKIEC
jgi:hypothetical protein